VFTVPAILTLGCLALLMTLLSWSIYDTNAKIKIDASYGRYVLFVSEISGLGLAFIATLYYLHVLYNRHQKERLTYMLEHHESALID